jgi:SAM-dependent methyltransferase
MSYNVPASSRNPNASRDYLWPQLRDLPYFRGLLRAVEARFYEGIDLPGPILDVGCGDGHFASVTFDHDLDVGLDPWGPPIREARQRGKYRLLAQGDGARMPFANAVFGSAISNSVLEHILQIDAVLKETGRVLKPGAPFAFCVPNHQFTPALSMSRALNRVGLSGLSARYEVFFNRIARHVHLDGPDTWAERLQSAGFEVESWWHYYSPSALAVTEWGHLFGLPSLAARKLTGRWILTPQPWNLALTDRLCRPHYAAPPVSEDGVCTFYIARRTA